MLASLSPHGVCHIEASPVWTLGTAPGRRADRVRQRRAERNAYRRVSRMAVSGVEAAQCRPGAPGPVPVSKRRRQASTRFYSHMSKLKILSFVGADPIHQTLGPGHGLRKCARTCAPRRRDARQLRPYCIHIHMYRTCSQHVVHVPSVLIPVPLSCWLLRDVEVARSRGDVTWPQPWSFLVLVPPNLLVVLVHAATRTA